ncbi:MAG: hypothetical protein AB9835_12510 [Eubacteriales bacterium]
MSENSPKAILKPSLARYSLVARLRTIVLSLLWYAAWVLGYVIYLNKYGKYWSLEYGYVGMLVLPLIFLIPFITLKLHKVLIDSYWEGKITKVKFDYYDIAQPGMPLQARLDREKVIIKGDSEKHGQRTFIYLNNKHISFDYYKENDQVRHHKGLRYLEKVDKTKDHLVICLKCGYINEMEKDTCYNCGLELQK